MGTDNKPRWRRNHWVLDYRDQNGRRRWETTKYSRPEDYEKAVKLLARREEEINKGEYQARHEHKKFEELVEAYRSAHINVNIRETTKKDYEGRINNHLLPYFKGWKIRTITSLGVEQFRADTLGGTGRCSKKVGRRQVNKVLILLGAMFRYAIKHRWATFNPVDRDVKLKEEGRKDGVIDENILKPDEIQLLLSKFESKEERWRLMAKTALLTGLREGELFGLRWIDFDWVSKQAHVRQQYVDGRFSEPETKKGRRSVDVPVDLLSELKRWKLRCPIGEHDLVFPNGAGNPENHGNLLRRGFYPALRRAELRQIRFHDLRHTFASLLIENGEHPKYISEKLGHSSIKITMDVYGHLMNPTNSQAAEKLSRLALGKTKKEVVGSKMVANSKMNTRSVSRTSQPLDFKMPRGGIEPSTQGFSGLCSTD